LTRRREHGFERTLDIRVHRGIETGHGVTLSPLNPMGVKGAGEAGAIPVGPLFAQALEDALHDVDFEILEIPLNSNRLWEIVNSK